MMCCTSSGDMSFFTFESLLLAGAVLPFAGSAFAGAAASSDLQPESTPPAPSVSIAAAIPVVNQFVNRTIVLLPEGFDLFSPAPPRADGAQRIPLRRRREGWRPASVERAALRRLPIAASRASNSRRSDRARADRGAWYRAEDRGLRASGSRRTARR